MSMRNVGVVIVCYPLLVASCTWGCTPGVEPVPGDGSETPMTLRIDLIHTGSANDESFGLDELILEGPWPGSPSHALDELGYGPYFFEVREAESGRPLFSQGFASIFGEWQTIPEARDTTLTFHESLRVPAPNRPISLAIYKRDPSMDLQEIWRTVIDPEQARPSSPESEHHVWTVMENGAPPEKIDILLLGDGYTTEELEKWHHDARRLTDTLFSYEPFKSRRRDFNVRAIDTPSNVSGIANPSAGLTHETPIGATYDSFGMERYVLTFANKRWRNVAAAAPYEFVIIVANNEKYGGAGIYNLFSTVSADNEFTSYVLVHEFGHHFAGLGDEYYTSNVTYETGQDRPEPWSPNVTADGLQPKWGDLVADSTPLPTPWPKVEFEALQNEIQSRRTKLRAENAPEAEMEALFRKERERSGALLGGAAYAHEVGTFEGANYASTGYYRPQINCIMFTRDVRYFCRVCDRAINGMVDRYSQVASAIPSH